MNMPNVRVKVLKINDEDVSAGENQTILEVADENNIFIPTLCHLEGLSPVGACRLCVVEIKGSSKLVPACITRVEEGMEVYTESERLHAYRLMIMQMLFAEGNHVCAVCISNGHCELQNLAQKLGFDHSRLEYHASPRHVDLSHERYGLDHNRCVLCTRCVRVCQEIEGAATLNIQGRGINCAVITDLDEPWGNSDTCTSCGKCVQVCPTGALFAKGKAAAEMTKRRDFLPYLKSMRENGNK